MQVLWGTTISDILKGKLNGTHASPIIHLRRIDYIYPAGVYFVKATTCHPEANSLAGKFIICDPNFEMVFSHARRRPLQTKIARA